MANYISKNNLQQYSTEVTAKYKKLFIPSNEVYAEDKVPYLFKATGDGSEMGTRMTDKVIGGTVAWNQLVNPDNYANVTTSGYVSNGITFTKQSDGSILANGTSEGGSSTGILLTLYAIAGHKYLLRGCPSGGGTTTYGFGSGAIATGSREHGNGAIFTYGTGGIGLTFAVADGVTVNNIVIKPQVFDLTQTLGTTIADYIYNLEQTTAGAGVAWFKHYFPKDYYAYNTGELMSVNAGSHNTIGFNQWDEEWEVGSFDSQGQKVDNSATVRSKNKIKVIPNTPYYVRVPSGITYSGLFMWAYDADENYLGRLDKTGIGGSNSVSQIVTFPSNVCYINFIYYITPAVYNHDICINISNTDKNGTYEPYIKHTYPLDNNLELRGIPKLDSDNKLYYDGDLYESNGNVTRRYGIVDLGTLNWTYHAAGGRYDDYFDTYLPNDSVTGVSDQEANIFCAKGYKVIQSRYIAESGYSNDVIALADQSRRLIICDKSYTSESAFETAMSGVYLVYELATATSETADPYVNPQVINSFGTEEYIDYAYAAGTRDVAIPVGHDSIYADAFLEKLENAPDNPYKDGDFIVNSKDGFNSYTELDPWLEENGYSKTTALLDTTLSIEGKAADAKAVGDAITAEEERAEDTYAKQKGSYPDLSSGQLLSTVELQDKVPYNFRTAGGSADIGIDLTEKIVGGSLGWNQQIGLMSSSAEVYGVTRTAVDDGKGLKYTISNCTQTTNYTANDVTNTAGHIYFVTLGNVTLPTGCRLSLASVDKTTTYLGILIGSPRVNIGVTISAGVTAEFTVYPQLFNLTTMFGSTIADYIYTLEQANEGDGVAWFKRYFPKDYYAYNAGGLESVKAGSHNTTGLNQWDEQWEAGDISETTGANVVNASYWRCKNYIPVIPNTSYYFINKSTTTAFRIYWYDAAQNFVGYTSTTLIFNNNIFTIPDSVHYMRFRYANVHHDDDIINLNLHWDGERDGEYEPFVEHTYELDNSLELRGIPKLDANNDLYYDGDEYESDGTVTRRYGIVDLDGLSWTYDNNYGVWYSLPVTKIKRPDANSDKANIISSNYISDTVSNIISSSTRKINTIGVSTGGGIDVYNDSSITQPTGYLVYELATPTTESATPYTNPQKVNNWGTEQYVDYAYEAGTRDMEIPVGHDSFYTNDLRAKVEMAPNSPDGDGYYIVHQHNGINRYTSPDDIALTEAEYQEIYNTLISGNA